MISQLELINLLHYNKNTGIFTRKSGKKCGNITKHGYLRIKINNKQYMAHRLAWLYITGRWPVEQIDHSNRIRHDNRWCNLREATSRANSKNRGVSKNNKSGITGVCFCSASNKWLAYYYINRKRIDVGSYNSISEAAGNVRIAKTSAGFSVNS